MTHKKELVTIIGGAGAVGELYANLFATNNYQVAILDTNTSIAEQLAKENNYLIADKYTVQKSDIVIFSVPIDKTVKTIEEYGKSIKDGALVMDTTSVKINPMQALWDNVREGVDICGTHPMFKPTVEFEGQNVAFIEERISKKGETRLKEIYRIFADAGADIVPISADKHDKAMAIIQGLVHIQNMLLVAGIKDSDFTIEELAKLSSPVYNIRMDYVFRMFAGDPELYGPIQQDNPYCPAVMEKMFSHTKQLLELIKEDPKKLINYLYSLKDFLGGSAKEALKRTDQQIGTPRDAVEIYFRNIDLPKIKEIYNPPLEIEKIKRYNKPEDIPKLLELHTVRKKQIKEPTYEVSYIAHKEIITDGKPTFVVDEENTIMKATIPKNEKSLFTENKYIVLAEETPWDMRLYPTYGNSVFLVDKLSCPNHEEYKRIIFTPMISKDPKKVEERHNALRLQLHNFFRKPELNFFEFIRTYEDELKNLYRIVNKKSDKPEKIHPQTFIVLKDPIKK